MIQSKHHHQASNSVFGECLHQTTTIANIGISMERKREKKLVNAECCVIVVVQKKNDQVFFSVSFPS